MEINYASRRFPQFHCQFPLRFSPYFAHLTHSHSSFRTNVRQHERLSDKKLIARLADDIKDFLRI